MDFVGSVSGPTRPAPAGNPRGQEGDEDEEDEGAEEEEAEEESSAGDDTSDAAESPPSESWISSHEQSAAGRGPDLQRTGVVPSRQRAEQSSSQGVQPMRSARHEAPVVPPPPPGRGGGGGRDAATGAPMHAARQGGPGTGSHSQSSEEEDDDTEDEDDKESSAPSISAPDTGGNRPAHTVSAAELPQQIPTFTIQKGGGVQTGNREQLGPGAASGSASAATSSTPGMMPVAATAPATAQGVAGTALQPLESSTANAGFLDMTTSLDMASEQASSDTTTTVSADESSRASSMQASGGQQDVATRLSGHPPEPPASTSSARQVATLLQGASAQGSSVPVVGENAQEEQASFTSWLLGAPCEAAVSSPPRQKACEQRTAKHHADLVGESRIPSLTGDYATVWMKASCPSTSEQLVDEVAGTYEVDGSMTSRHNLRSSPSTSAPIVGMLLGGDVVDVVEVLSLPDEEGQMIEKRRLLANSRPAFIRWGRLARLGRRPQAEGGDLYTMISDGFNNVYLKCLKRFRPASGADGHSATSPYATSSTAAASMESATQNITEARRLHLSVAQVLGDPAAEHSMVKELYHHQAICAALEKKADRELLAAQELDNQVAALKKLNETRKKVAPQLVEQRQESFRRWGAWQTEVLDLNASRLRTLQNMQTQVQNAEREMEQRFQQTRGARQMAVVEATMDVELSRSLTAMEAQTARCYLKLVGSPSDARG